MKVAEAGAGVVNSTEVSTGMVTATTAEFQLSTVGTNVVFASIMSVRMPSQQHQQTRRQQLPGRLQPRLAVHTRAPQNPVRGLLDSECTLGDAPVLNHATDTADVQILAVRGTSAFPTTTAF